MRKHLPYPRRRERASSSKHKRINVHHCRHHQSSLCTAATHRATIEVMPSSQVNFTVCQSANAANTSTRWASPQRARPGHIFPSSLAYQQCWSGRLSVTVHHGRLVERLRLEWVSLRPLHIFPYFTRLFPFLQLHEHSLLTEPCGVPKVLTNHGLFFPHLHIRLLNLIFLRKLATTRCRYDHTRKSEKAESKYTQTTPREWSMI